MPLSRIEIEQIESARWVAEVEAGGTPGGPPFKRYDARPDNGGLSGASFEDIMAKVTAVMYRACPPQGGVVTRDTLVEIRVPVVEPSDAPKRRGRPPKVDGDTVVE